MAEIFKSWLFTCRSKMRRCSENPIPAKSDPRTKLLRFFEEPKSSTPAFVFSGFLTVCIIVSVATFAMETMPEWSHRALMWFQLETTFILLFSAEYLSRLLLSVHSESHPGFSFFFDWYNLFDLLAILPYYVEIAINGFGPVPIANEGRCTVCSYLRFFRTFRLLKLSRMYSHGADVLFKALALSTRVLRIPVFFLVVACLFFASVVYFLERGTLDLATGVRVTAAGVPSQFTSIPRTIWFILVTMTTVGYGETVPYTMPGKLMTMLAIVIGLLFMAVPIAVMGDSFLHIWKQTQLEKSREQRGVGPPVPLTRHLDLYLEYTSLSRRIAFTRRVVSRLLIQGEQRRRVALRTAGSSPYQQHAAGSAAATPTSPNGVLPFRPPQLQAPPPTAVHPHARWAGDEADDTVSDISVLEAEVMRGSLHYPYAQQQQTQAEATAATAVEPGGLPGDPSASGAVAVGAHPGAYAMVDDTDDDSAAPASASLISPSSVDLATKGASATPVARRSRKPSPVGFAATDTAAAIAAGAAAAAAAGGSGGGSGRGLDFILQAERRRSEREQQQQQQWRRGSGGGGAPSPTWADTTAAGANAAAAAAEEEAAAAAAAVCATPTPFTGEGQELLMVPRCQLEALLDRLEMLEARSSAISNNAVQGMYSDVNESENPLPEHTRRKLARKDSMWRKKQQQQRGAAVTQSVAGEEAGIELTGDAAESTAAAAAEEEEEYREAEEAASDSVLDVAGTGMRYPRTRRQQSLRLSATEQDHMHRFFLTHRSYLQRDAGADKTIARMFDL